MKFSTLVEFEGYIDDVTFGVREYAPDSLDTKLEKEIVRLDRLLVISDITNRSGVKYISIGYGQSPGRYKSAIDDNKLSSIEKIVNKIYHGYIVMDCRRNENYEDQ